MFLANKFIFNYKMTFFTIIVISLTIIILMFVNWLHVFSGFENSLSKNLIVKPYTLWQILMSLGIQLILYQEELLKIRKTIK